MLKTESTSSECSPTLDETLSRCISIPLATAWAYTERPGLSKELQEHLRRVQDDIELAHAVAVTGPEGTGKTQLVLRFVEENEQDYDVVLWIDVQSEEAVRSSFERCCHALRLPFDNSTTHASLQSMPCVQAVLSLLCDEAGEKRWLIVFDNADDLPWDLDALVPKGHNGTVVIISRNVTVGIPDPVTLLIILEKAGKPGSGLICASPFPCVCSSSSYVLVIQASTGLRPRPFIALYSI